MWQFGTIKIAVQDFKDSSKQTIARLQPLGANTVKQIFGYDSPIANVSGFLIGEADKSALQAYRTTHSSYSLTDSHSTSHGNYYLASVSFTRVSAIGQTVRSDLSCDSPVYRVEMELQLDD